MSVRREGAPPAHAFRRSLRNAVSDPESTDYNTMFMNEAMKVYCEQLVFMGAVSS